MAVADSHGLPIGAWIGSGQKHETQLVSQITEGLFVSRKPLNLIGDKAYDSEQLDRDMHQLGIELIAPERRKKRKNTQDKRRLRRYKRRWLIERLFAWLKRMRRLNTRWEHKADNFLGFLHLGCLKILLSQV